MTKKKSIVILTIFTILVVLGTVFAFVSLDHGELGIYDYKAFPKTIKFGLDLSGGVYAVYDIDKTAVVQTNEDGKEMTWYDLDDPQKKKDLLEGTRSSLESLLFEKGYSEAVVTAYDNHIRIEVPNEDDPDRLFSLIGRPATLEFKYYEGQYEKGKGLSYKDPITGNDIAETGVTLNNQNGKYEVALRFNKAGAEKFAKATDEASKSESRVIGIYINGEEIIAPEVKEAIAGGNASISGNYSYDDAYALAVQIQAGSFPLVLKISQSSTISPTLGENAIKAGLIGGAIGIALIIIYICIMYRMMGVAASMALIYYALTYLFFLSIIPWVQLTLAGIAGVLLSIGMAVDANVIIFERVKEEYANHKKTIKSSMDTGFKRSYGAIIDGNVTTIIGAIVLIIVGAASIKGFGITLLVGILLSLLSSLFLSRLLLNCIRVFFTEEQASVFGLKRKLENSENNVGNIELVKEDVENE